MASSSLWGERNQSPLDWWTLAHVLSGIASGLLGITFWATLAAGTVYELVEPAFDYEVFGAGFTRQNYQPESVSNRVVDVVSIAAGWMIGFAIREATGWRPSFLWGDAGGPFGATVKWPWQ